MSDPLLTFLKYIFLAILYLFFLRVLRAVWIELREPKPAPITAGPAPAPAPGPVREDAAATVARERLVVVDPPERRGQEFPLGDELTVGRAGAAASHCPTTPSSPSCTPGYSAATGELYVEDLGLHQRDLPQQGEGDGAVPMRKGDKLKIGKTTLEVRR